MKCQENKVWKLEKSLYTLKESQWAQYEKLIEHLLKLNFNHYDLGDATLFVKKVGKNNCISYGVCRWYFDDREQLGIYFIHKEGISERFWNE